MVGKWESLSMVICTHDRAEPLRETLEALYNQDMTPGEVIVIDDHTPNESIEKTVRSLSRKFEAKDTILMYVRNEGRRGLTSSRNYGSTLAKGDFILFLDDDVIVDSLFIKSLMNVYLSDPNVLGVQGFFGPSSTYSSALHAFQQVFCMASRSLEDCAVLPSMRSVYPTYLSKPRPCQWLSGANQSYKRVVLSERKFDENLRMPPSGEDVDFSYRIYLQRPGSLVITPHAKAEHKGGKKLLNWEQRSLQQTIYKAYSLFKYQRMGAPVSFRMFVWERLGFMLLQLLLFVSGKGTLTRYHRIKVIKGVAIGLARVIRYRSHIRIGRLTFFL